MKENKNSNPYDELPYKMEHHFKPSLLDVVVFFLVLGLILWAVISFI